jgi:predicted Zn-dependent peptidase
LVAEEMPWLKSVAMSFLVPSGTAREPGTKGGLAGFTCETILRGAGQRDNRQLILDFDNLGIERSETLSPAHTIYSGVTVSDHLLPALEIYADLLQRAHLPDDYFEADRQSMLQELMAIEDEPSQKMMIELRRTFYAEPWGRPSQGTQEGILAVTIDDIRQYYKDHYQPDGLILGVAGKFCWEELCETVGELFGAGLSNNGKEFRETGIQQANLHVPYDSLQTHIGIAYPNVPYRDPNYFEAWGAVGVLGSGMSSRLATEVRERRGLCYSVYSFCDSLRDHGAVFCYAGTSSDRAQETLDVIKAELVRLREGITEEEINRLKARIKSALVMQQESSASRSTGIAKDWYHLGRVRTLAELDDRISSLDAASINAYLNEHPPADLSVITLGTEALKTGA